MTNEENTSMDDTNETDDFMAELEKLESQFEGSEEKSFAEIPDGNYMVLIQKAEAKNSKSGKPMVSQTLKIMSGEFKGRLLFRHTVFDTPTGLSILKTDLKEMGIALANLRELKSRVVEMLDLKLKVQQKTKGEFVNIYLQKCMGKATLEEIEAMASNAGSTGDDDGFGDDFGDDEDIPF